MIPYLIAFSLSLIFIALSIKFDKKGYKKGNKICVFISIFIISLFAGLRSETIGTDVLVYVKPYLDFINLYGLNWLMKYSDCEILYLLFTTFVSILGGDLKLLLFLITFLISLLVYLYAYDNKDETDLFSVYAVYLFVFLGISFNLVRQSIAMAIILYSTKYLRNKKIFKFIISIIIASLFHSSSLIMLVLYPMYSMFGKKTEPLFKFIIIILSVVIVVFIPFLSNYLYLISSRFNPDKFKDAMYSHININYTWEFVKIITLLFMLGLLKYNKNIDNNKYNLNYFNFCKFLLILDFIFFQMGAIFKFSERFSYYFMLISYMYLIPCFLDIFLIDSKKNVIAYIFIFLILLFYFYFIYVQLGVSSIIPYKFG